MVTDNATNNAIMCQLLEEKLPEFNSEHNWIRCIAHIMHLAVTTFLEKLGSVPYENEEDCADSETVTHAVGKVSCVPWFYYV